MVDSFKKSRRLTDFIIIAPLKNSILFNPGDTVKIIFEANG
jgi:hypothetical protein